MSKQTIITTLMRVVLGIIFLAERSKLSLDRMFNKQVQ